MDERSAITQSAGTSPSSSLVCGPASRPWRRQLGALAWAALEELALTSHPDDHGWVSPVGVGAIATGIGTTAATAVRAVAALCAAGLVVLEPVTDLNGQRRLGYRLHLPDGIELRHCPHQNGDAAQGLPRGCPDDQDTRSPRSIRPSSAQPRRSLVSDPSGHRAGRARRSVATTRPNRAGPPHHPDITNPADDTPRSSNERKRTHARRAQPVGPSRRLPAAQPLRQPRAHRQRPRRVPGPLHHARSTRTGSCPRRNASAEPSAPARPTTQPWPPNPPEPDAAGARSGRTDRPKMKAEPDVASCTGAWCRSRG